MGNNFLRVIIFLSIVFINAVDSYAQWQSIGPGGGSDLHFAAIQPDNADVIYVGGDIEGIFKTTNGGTTWKNINNNIVHSYLGGGVYWTNDIVLDPANYNRVYFCSGVGLFKSENAGDYWNLIYPLSYLPGDEAISVSTIAIDPNNSNRLFIGLGDGAVGSLADFEPFADYDQPTGVFKSLDGGVSWEELNVGMPAFTNVHSIMIVPNEPEKIIISTSKGIYKSSNGGDSWQSSNNGLPHTNVHRLVGKKFGNDFVLYATIKTLGNTSNPNSFKGGIFKSADFGNNWIDITGNLPRYNSDSELFFDYWKLDTHPTNPNIIVTAATRGSSYYDSGIYVTYDGGVSWNYVYYPVIGGWMENWFFDPYGFDIKIAPSDPNRWVLLLVDVEISNDAGNTWNQAFTTQVGTAWKGNGLELMNTETISFHPTNPDILWIGYDDMGLFRSEDGGNSFIRLDPAMNPTIGNLLEIDAVKDIEVDPLNGDLYISRYQGSQGGYLADYSSGGILFSNDMGNTQIEISSGLPSGRHDLILNKQTGQPGSRTLYASVFHHGVYKSTNSGSRWISINNGLGGDAQYAWEIVYDPSNSETLYLGLNRRGAGLKNLYKSTNGGQSWQQLSNFPPGDVLSIYSNSKGLYSGVTDNFDWNTNGGLYFSSDDGASWTKILEHSRVTDISSKPGDDNTLLAVGQQWFRIGADIPSLFLSTDGGNNWNDISNGLNNTFINTARFHPYRTNEIFICTAGGGLWRTDYSTDVVKEESIPVNYALFHNYPNPFNPSTTIRFQLPVSNHVTLKVFDNLGKEVATLVNEKKSAGNYEVNFNSSKISSGVYFYRLTAGSFSILKKMILLR